MTLLSTSRRLQIWAALALVVLAMFSSARASETLTFIHTDIAGSPWAATDSGGKLVWREAYRPYGERTKNRPAAETNRNFFHGKAFDADTGLTYFGARYYDVAVGRFMGLDPQSFDERNIHSFNRYSYGNNNPQKYRDPDGQAPSPIDIFFAALSAGELVAVGGLNIYGRVAGDQGLVQVTNASLASVTGSLVQDLAGLINPVPGANGLRRTANAVERSGEAAARGEMMLYRYREGPEGANRLARQATAAEGGGLPHGVSVTSNPDPGRACAGAKCSDIEKHFPVHKTGGPGHYTVELPKPVTRKDADTFNRLFKDIQ